MTTRLRALVRDNARRADGNRILKIGISFGYWPCLRAPFIQFNVGVKTVDVWFGLPSNKEPKR